MSAITEYLVSKSGQMSVPAQVRHRWGLGDGGRIAIMDLGDVVVLLPPGGRRQLLDSALTADEYIELVTQSDDPDLATT